MPSYSFFHIDAFANEAFKGNPAAIIPVPSFPDAALMQTIAAENNIAETAFIVAKENGVWDLRWFTPAVEVPLCGHATLAAAHAIWAHEGFKGNEIGFDTKSGRLTVQKLDDGRLEMDFPANTPEQVPPRLDISEALGETPAEYWQGDYMVAVYEKSEQIINLEPDFLSLKNCSIDPKNTKNWVTCVAPANGKHKEDGFDIVARFFAPGSGADEDPATGSAHCILAPLFAEKLGKTELKSFQAFPGRGAEISMKLDGGRVKLRGKAMTLIEGKIYL